MTDWEKEARDNKQPEWLKPGYWENRPWIERLEEAGDLHDEGCACNTEDPDECDCDTFVFLKDFISKEIIRAHQQGIKEGLEMAREIASNYEGYLDVSEEWSRSRGYPVKVTIQSNDMIAKAIQAKIKEIGNDQILHNPN